MKRVLLIIVIAAFLLSPLTYASRYRAKGWYYGCITDGAIELPLDCYVGHNGLLDFCLDNVPEQAADGKPKDIIILACLSKDTFIDILDPLGGYPLLWTTGLLAPEAYVLDAAIEGWLNLEDTEKILDRAISAYCKYQKCTRIAAKNIFRSGW